ncbi:MAG: hypothetical protein IJ247_01235 [Bacilli bacterium]|nr:hypothetical protein [Bacilli bacterium]
MKKKRMAILAVGAASILASAILLSNPDIALFAENLRNTSNVWVHYQEVSPTFTVNGIKEYWVSCSSNEHVFVEPTGDVEIQEGVWSDQKKADVIALNDDRLLDTTLNYAPSSLSSTNGLVTVYTAEEYTWMKANLKSISFDVDFNGVPLTNVAGGASFDLSDVKYFSLRKTASDALLKNFTLTDGVAHVTIDSTVFDDANTTYIRFRLKGSGNENVNFVGATVSNVVGEAKASTPAHDIPSTISSTNGLVTVYDADHYTWIKENVASITFDVDFNGVPLTNVAGGASFDLSDVKYFSLRKTASDALLKNFTLTDGVAHVTIDSTVFDDANTTYIRFRLKGSGNENVNFVDASVSNLVVTLAA